jgi:hypothetical protein
MHYTYTKTKGKLRSAAIRTFYTPQIWIEHSAMFATCPWFIGKAFVDMSIVSRRAFENRLMQALRDDWGVLAQNLRLKYSTGKVEVIFEDKDEFIMAKMANGELNSQL